MLYGETKHIINNVFSYNKILKQRTMSFLQENPECAKSLRLYFEATGISINNALLQTATMTGVSKSTIHRYYQQQTTRESLEPQKCLCGVKQRVFPDWCLGAIRNIIMRKYSFLYSQYYSMHRDLPFIL